MPELPRYNLPFGQGLDRETGIQVVKPGSFEDLRNWLLHQGKMIPRPGFTDNLTLLDDDDDPISHVVQGFPLRSERIGVIVGYQQATEKVFVYRIDSEGVTGQLLGEWVNDQPGGWGGLVPKVHMAESYGRVFIAHDRRIVQKRAPTIYYDPIFGAGALVTLTGDFQGLGDHSIRFRGVVRHLKYMFGWGYGDESEDKPEYVRSSVAGDPTMWNTNHFFIAGDRRDPVLMCQAAGTRLLVQKESETHVVFGTGRDDFGIDLLDPLYGVLDTHLATNYSGLVIAWTAEGPRAFDGNSPSTEIAIPLDLSGPDPATLVAEGLASTAFAHYLPDLRIIVFVFGRRVYALTVRVEGDWKWSYWELGFDPLCAFTLFRSNEDAVAPPGYPVYVPPAGLGARPPVILDAIGAWRVQDVDADQERVLLDRSGNGAHLYLGPPAAKDSVLGDGPLGVGKRGVVSTEQADRGLAVPNTVQALNVGGAGEDLRVTINFSAYLDDGDQTLVAHGASGTTRSWRIGIGATGVITAALSEDGTAESSLTSTATLLVAGGFAHWADIWIRATFDLAADELLFEYSSDGIAWLDLEASASYGTARASFFQPAAADGVEIGGRVLGTVEKLRGGGVYSILVEEDSGGGYVEAWSWNGGTVPYVDLEELGNQGVADAADPNLTASALEIVRNVSECRTWESVVTAITDLSDQFDVVPGETLTVILFASMNPVNAGPAGIYTPFAKKLDELAASEGWAIENDGTAEGFDFRVTEGADQDPTAVAAIVDDDELKGTVYEIDNVDSEIRMRQVGLVPVAGVYADQGSGTNDFGVMFGRRGAAGSGMTMNLRGAAIWKRKLTVAEMVSASAWLEILS